MTKDEQLDQLALTISQLVCDDVDCQSMVGHMVEAEIGRDGPTSDKDEEYWRTTAIVLMKSLLRAADSQIHLIESNLH